MKLFDIANGKVIIHPDGLGIPPFGKIWESNSDKDYATKVIQYIILKNKWDSPYVTGANSDSREAKLKEQIFGDVKHQLTADELEAEKQYNELQYSDKLEMLDAMRTKLKTVTKWYLSSLEDELDEKRIKDLYAGMEKASGVIKTLDYLEKAVKLDEVTKTSRTLGDRELNPYEMPNK